jgi:hypothetical protein
MVINDASSADPTSYFTPLTYRGAPLSDAEDHLIGTTEHGVLGRRWVYDGAHDPVFVNQVLALLRGDVEAQSQNESNMIDSTVFRELSVVGELVPSGAMRIESGPASTDVQGLTLSSRTVELRVVRALRAADDEPYAKGSVGEIVANWTRVGGPVCRGALVFVAET